MQIQRETIPMVMRLQKELQNCNSVLDLGCGQSSMLKYIHNIKFSTGVEIWKPYIYESELLGIHTEYINMDVTKFETSRPYDATICVDVIEHIEKNNALKLINKMKKWSIKKIIIIVPNGYLENGDPYDDGNVYQHHLSGWSPKDFTDLGFEVIGFNGYKYCRGDGSNIRIIHPYLRPLYAIISYLSEPFCKIFPNYAYHLFAIYTFKEDI